MIQNTFLQYLQFEKRYSPKTLINYKCDISQFAKFLSVTYEEDRMEKAEASHIRSWMVDLINHGITPRSINRKLSALKTFYKFLLKRQLIEQNPLSKIVNPKSGKKLPVFLSKESLDRLFHEVTFEDGFSGARDRIILEVLYATGMRRAELVQLKVNDIDFEQRQIKVKGKGNKERLIPFTHHLEHSIRAYLQARQTLNMPLSDHFILDDKGAMAKDGLIYKTVKQYLSLVSTIEKKSPHVLRHSFATHLADNGADLNAIKELLGHSSLASTQVYTHNTIEKLRKVYDQAHPKA